MIIWESRLQAEIMEVLMDALVEKLDTKLRQWNPDIAEQVRQYIADIIEMAD